MADNFIDETSNNIELSENKEDTTNAAATEEGQEFLTPVEPSKPLLDFATSKASDGLSKVEEEEIEDRELGAENVHEFEPEEENKEGNFLKLKFSRNIFIFIIYL